MYRGAHDYIARTSDTETNKTATTLHQCPPPRPLDGGGGLATSVNTSPRACQSSPPLAPLPWRLMTAANPVATDSWPTTISRGMPGIRAGAAVGSLQKAWDGMGNCESATDGEAMNCEPSDRTCRRLLRCPTSEAGCRSRLRKSGRLKRAVLPSRRLSRPEHTGIKNKTRTKSNKPWSRRRHRLTRPIKIN